ncbi:MULTISPECIES: hypothetical protein [Micromonosporaceae]|uniref:hypothetical protein n=1 Tax=Micromonosporaceae TaxID=28056 RepID=UPI000F45F9C3|nr:MULTISPECIES: hypothetical protein [Micromonosporaceae]ROO61796.1 hypothetical protein EDC02_3753 [Micromonospora sp. Llam0]ROO62032.1 hypothetical protein EDC02_3996 [Micromonospora sp. Llam0]WFE29847.1 hypothetical protein O7623_11980 [Solwaraspora sp. WMMD791]WFE30073.1 hypothetical protein O7623_13185 [Solwaraspora sp. WMMD791]
MVPASIKVPVPFEYVFPAGALFLGVDAQVDFDRRGEADNQARDKETGERVWVVRVLDLDAEAGKFGRSTEVKVKIVAGQRPVPPSSTVPGYPPAVEFDGLTLTPYVDSHRCRASGQCRARMAYSLRATGMQPASAHAPAAA